MSKSAHAATASPSHHGNGLRSVESRGPRNPTLPSIPSADKRIDVYNVGAPRDAVNSLSNKTKNHTIWPKPHYVPPVVHRYRANGGGRDLWIDGLATETKGIHFVSDTELYWKSKLGQPEYRGKCKPALCSGNDRWILYPSLKKVHSHPLVPRIAKMAEEATSAMPPVKRTVFSGQWRVVEEKNNALRCDALMEQLLAEQKFQGGNNNNNTNSKSGSQTARR
jgi:hypothetical protein